MATVTSTAPTEEKIRAAYHERGPKYEPFRRLREGLYEEFVPFADPFRWIPANDVGSSELGDEVWCDLRPSEATDLEQLIDEAFMRAVHRTMAILEEEVVAAALAFAAAHPDASRARGLVTA